MSESAKPTVEVVADRLSAYLNRAEKGMGKPAVLDLLSERYDVHAGEACDPDPYCDEEHADPDERLKWRELVEAEHASKTMRAMSREYVHDVGTFRTCSAELCRGAAELLNER